jgi:nicotinamidase-related amidase
MQKILSKDTTALLIVDVQERLFSKMHSADELLSAIILLFKGATLFSLPIVISEQYPKGLGSTVKPLQNLFKDTNNVFGPFAKTAFSCLGNTPIAEFVKKLSINNWIIAGIECHVCVLQTAKDLMHIGCNVIIPEDATSSRSIRNFDRGIKELEQDGARVTTVETILFELARDSSCPEFKELNKLVK